MKTTHYEQIDLVPRTPEARWRYGRYMAAQAAYIREYQRTASICYANRAFDWLHRNFSNITLLNAK